MDKDRLVHPSSEELAEFAENRAGNATSIEAHLDSCEQCAFEVLLAREALAFDSLHVLATSTPAERATQESRSRQLLRQTPTKSKSSQNDESPKLPATSSFGVKGTLGAIGGIIGIGAGTHEPKPMLAGSDPSGLIHPPVHPPHGDSHGNSENFETGVIPGHDLPSNQQPTKPEDTDGIAHFLEQVQEMLEGDGTDSVATETESELSPHEDAGVDIHQEVQSSFPDGVENHVDLTEPSSDSFHHGQKGREDHHDSSSHDVNHHGDSMPDEEHHDGFHHE